jgi:hypothetical protein
MDIYNKRQQKDAPGALGKSTANIEKFIRASGPKSVQDELKRSDKKRETMYGLLKKFPEGLQLIKNGHPSKPSEKTVVVKIGPQGDSSPNMSENAWANQMMQGAGVVKKPDPRPVRPANINFNSNSPPDFIPNWVGKPKMKAAEIDPRNANPLGRGARRAAEPVAVKGRKKRSGKPSGALKTNKVLEIMKMNSGNMRKPTVSTLIMSNNPPLSKATMRNIVRKINSEMINNANRNARVKNEMKKEQNKLRMLREVGLYSPPKRAASARPFSLVSIGNNANTLRVALGKRKKSTMGPSARTKLRILEKLNQMKPPKSKYNSSRPINMNRNSPMNNMSPTSSAGGSPAASPVNRSPVNSNSSPSPKRQKVSTASKKAAVRSPPVIVMGKSAESYKLPSLRKVAKGLLALNGKAFSNINAITNKKTLGKIILEAQKQQNKTVNLFSKLKI